MKNLIILIVLAFISPPLALGYLVALVVFTINE